MINNLIQMRLIKTFLLALCLIGGKVWAEPVFESWNLPRHINDSNAKIAFSLDSTWHTVHGKTSGIDGEASLSDLKNPQSVRVKLEIPVSKFNTDNESRDEELRDIMNEKEFPNVEFRSTGLKGSCTPTLVKSTGSCEDILISELKIREIQNTLEIPISISLEGEDFVVKGKIPIEWEKYNVKDPSIFLIASVDPIVEIDFKIILRK